jgi:hypothetical protein
MPGLSEKDPVPDPRRGRPPIALLFVIATVVIAVVVLHLTGVIGPGSH